MCGEPWPHSRKFLVDARPEVMRALGADAGLGFVHPALVASLADAVLRTAVTLKPMKALHSVIPNTAGR